MMTLNFLNIKANNHIYLKLIGRGLLFVILLLNLNSVVAMETQSRFNWVCNNEKECNLFAVTNHGKKILMYKGNEDDKNHIGFGDYGNNLGSFFVSCGSPCNYTTFVNFETGMVSKKSFFLVKAVDPIQKEVAYLGKDIEIAPIFENNHKKILIKRDYSAGASLSVGKIRFINDNTIFAKYVAGKNFVPREENIVFNPND